MRPFNAGSGWAFYQGEEASAATEGRELSAAMLERIVARCLGTVGDVADVEAGEHANPLRREATGVKSGPLNHALPTPAGAPRWRESPGTLLSLIRGGRVEHKVRQFRAREGG